MKRFLIIAVLLGAWHLGLAQELVIDMSDDLGTLEPGKLADIVMIDGKPLDMTFDLPNVAVAIEGGKIVVAKR